jgi:hypothetical protein
VQNVVWLQWKPFFVHKLSISHWSYKIFLSSSNAKFSLRVIWFAHAIRYQYLKGAKKLTFLRDDWRVARACVVFIIRPSWHRVHAKYSHVLYIFPWCRQSINLLIYWRFITENKNLNLSRKTSFILYNETYLFSDFFTVSSINIVVCMNVDLKIVWNNKILIWQSVLFVMSE